MHATVMNRPSGWYTSIPSGDPDLVCQVLAELFGELACSYPDVDTVLLDQDQARLRVCLLANMGRELVQVWADAEDQAPPWFVPLLDHLAELVGVRVSQFAALSLPQANCIVGVESRGDPRAGRELIRLERY